VFSGLAVGERGEGRCEVGFMPMEVGLAVDVSVGMWETIGMVVTVNEG